jgi:competence protein ComEC
MAMNLMESKLLEFKNPIVLFTLGIIFGSSVYFQNIGLVYAFIAYSILSLLSLYFKKKEFILLGLGIVLSFFYCLEYIKLTKPNLDKHLNKQCIFIGRVLSEKKGIFNKKYTLEVSRIISDKETINQTFKADVTGSKYDNTDIDDIIEIKGKLKKPKSAILKGLFDERKYLLSNGIYYKINSKNGSVVYLDKGKTNPFIRGINTLRERIIKDNNRFLNKENASLANGILIGSKASPLDKNTKNRIQVLGLSHITSASGFNISILAGVIFFLTRKLFKRSSFIPTFISIGTIIFYTFLADLSSSIIRAAIFLVLVLLGSMFNKRIKILPGVSLITILFFLQNPVNLLDIGFQLSVFSFLGLTLFLEDVNKSILPHIHKSFHFIVFSILESFFAQLMTMPIIIFYFHNIQILGLIANIVAVPLASVILITGLLNTLIGFMPILIFIQMLVYKIIGLECFLFFKWIDLLSLIENKQIFIPRIDFYYTAFLYTFILLIAGIISIKKQRKPLVISLGISICLFFTHNEINNTKDYLKIFIFPKYNQQAVLVIKENKTPMFFSSRLDKKTEYQIKEFLKLNNLQEDFIFYNLKDKTSLISNSELIIDRPEKISIKHKMFTFELVKGYSKKINNKANVVELPILMKKDPDFHHIFSDLPNYIVVNDYKKLSKQSVKSIDWLKKQKTRVFFLSNSGTITIVCKDKNSFFIEEEG